jgi:hypothetical protein
VAVEGQRVAAFVWDALRNDSGAGGVNTLLGGTPATPGRIYRDQAPQAAQLPAAVIALVSSTDSNTLGGVRAFDVVLVDVRVVASGVNWGAIDPIADRVDVVLHGRVGTRSGVQVVELRRDQTQAFVEVDAGASFSHLIQTYRTEAHATA